MLASTTPSIPGQVRLNSKEKRRLQREAVQRDVASDPRTHASGDGRKGWLRDSERFQTRPTIQARARYEKGQATLFVIKEAERLEKKEASLAPVL